MHFLAKKELWRGFKKILFANMGLIPVDRSKKDHNSLVKAEEYLNNECLIGIFPEGTTEKGRGLSIYLFSKFAKSGGVTSISNLTSLQPPKNAFPHILIEAVPALILSLYVTV